MCDSSGRLHTLADSTSGAGTITYGYDDLDWLTSESGPSGSASCAYYADSWLKTLTPSSLAMSAYVYDAAYNRSRFYDPAIQRFISQDRAD